MTAILDTRLYEKAQTKLRSLVWKIRYDTTLTQTFVDCVHSFVSSRPLQSKESYLEIMEG